MEKFIFDADECSMFLEERGLSVIDYYIDKNNVVFEIDKTEDCYLDNDVILGELEEYYLDPAIRSFSIKENYVTIKIKKEYKLEI